MVEHLGINKFWALLLPVPPKEQSDMDNGWNLARGESSSCGSLIFKVEESNYNHSKKLQPGNKEREEPILSLSLLFLPPPFPPFSLSCHLTDSLPLPLLAKTKLKIEQLGCGGMMQLIGVNPLQPRARCRRKSGGSI